MKFRYTKYTGDLLDEIDFDDLVSKLSNLLLSSGFSNPWGDPSSGEDDRTMEALHDAILEALFSDGVLSEEALDRLMGDAADADQEKARQQIEDLIQQIIDRMMEEAFVTAAPDLEIEQEHRRGAGDQGEDSGAASFEVTDKALDFLGFRALRDLLGSMGRSHAGRHDTHDLSTGVETAAASKPYEFGDALNIDPSGTILNAVRRLHAAGRPAAAGQGTTAIDVDYPDLMVAQSEHQSSCATVIMLDCSHSMILYGEDRFTPAKRVALALSHLIRTQYPGDTLNAVLFHDSAEEIPLKQLGRVRVGPYYTNTRAGLRLARRILERQRKDMRQIIMITDGKPSAITRADGQIYKNAFGLDPYIVAETFAEVSSCQKAGIMINTFMLAQNHDLMAFVRRVAAMCRGKAYFTTPFTLGQYVLMDYMDRKTRMVH
jgi:Ca-activated chloride channel family protein